MNDRNVQNKVYLRSFNMSIFVFAMPLSCFVVPLLDVDPFTDEMGGLSSSTDRGASASEHHRGNAATKQLFRCEPL